MFKLDHPDGKVDELKEEEWQVEWMDGTSE